MTCMYSAIKLFLQCLFQFQCQLRFSLSVALVWFFFLSTFLSLFAESHRKLLKSIRRARAKRVKFLLAKAHCKNLTTSQYQENPRVIFAQKIRQGFADRKSATTTIAMSMKGFRASQTLVRKMSGATANLVLDNMNPCIKKMEYAVRKDIKSR